MYRFTIATAVVTAAFVFTAMNSASADDTDSKPKKVEVLGHMSEIDLPEEPVAEDPPKVPEAPKDPSFIPVSKLPEEPAPIDPTGPTERDRDDGSLKLRNLP